MSEETTVSLKEYFEALLRERDKAHDVMAWELERRLTLLNGEHAMLSTMSSTYLSREIYDHDMERARGEREATLRAAELARQSVDLQASINRRGVALAVSIALVGWLISGLFLYLSWQHS